MKHLLALALPPALLACAATDSVPAASPAPAAPPVVVDLDATPAPAAAPQPAPAKPAAVEAPAEEDPAKSAQPAQPGAGTGDDALEAQGNMWGSMIGESSGAGGLGLSGVGPGGGGKGEGIGLGNLGSLGHGAGTGLGSGRGRLGATRSKPPRVREDGTQVTGRLPTEVIQRFVRQHFAYFRLCYEKGLQGEPRLEGTIGVRFTIEPDGSVSGVGTSESTMPDKNVVTCVSRDFAGLRFPAPGAGKVAVVYTLRFSPGEEAEEPAKPAPSAAPAPTAPPPAPAKKP